MGIKGFSKFLNFHSHSLCCQELHSTYNNTMYLFHFAFCLFSFSIFTEAEKLTCNEVTNSTNYKDPKVNFKICKYLNNDEKCEKIVGTNFEGLEKKLNSIKFNPRERIAIITTGLLRYLLLRMYEYVSWMGEMGRNWALMEPDVNIIYVNWHSSEISNLEYRKAALQTEVVAELIAAFLEKLNQTYPKQRLHLHFVGLGLGAHLVGQAARTLKQSGIIVDRLTALDPALPCFKDNSSSLRLRKTDAEFVDVIHSNSGPEDMNLGIYEPMGHVDFYPNGGNHFPQCKNEILKLKKQLFCDGDKNLPELGKFFKRFDTEYVKARLQLFSDYKKNEDFLKYFFCKKAACNHLMSTKFFIESLNPNNTRRLGNSVPFPLNITDNVICHNYHNCDSETCFEMGYGAEQYKMNEGAYYVNTADDNDYDTCPDDEEK